MDLMNHLNNATVSLFRWESLQYYAVDARELDLFKTTGIADTKDMQEWWDFISTKKKDSVLLQRVRLVAEPMNDYTKMELAIHKESVKHGDDIRTITEEKYKQLEVHMSDFWLIDATTVLIMKYSPEGEYEGFERQEATQDYISFKDSLLRYSEPL